MKIAVTYDNGSVFQHFGKTENFKIFEVENGAIISSEVVGSNGAGHSALAGFLADAGVDVVICGGIGGGAQEALSEAGIKVCAGVSGDVNEAMVAAVAVVAAARAAAADATAAVEHQSQSWKARM